MTEWKTALISQFYFIFISTIEEKPQKRSNCAGCNLELQDHQRDHNGESPSLEVVIATLRKISL